MGGCAELVLCGREMLNGKPCPLVATVELEYMIGDKEGDEVKRSALE